MALDMYEKLKGELIKIFIEGGNLVDDDELWLDVISESMDSKRVLEIARELKENGNSYFKSENFEEALERYGYAEAILARFDFTEEVDRTEFCDLALCILLNSAACFSKLKDFEQVGQICTIILEFQPNNVKAMYRRAMAAVELGRYEWAFWDLVSAAEINPKNQEVAKLLVEVRDAIKRKKKKDQLHGECPKGLGIGLPPSTMKSPTVVNKQEMDKTLKDALVVNKENGDDIVKESNNAEDSGSLCTLEDMKREGVSVVDEGNHPLVTAEIEDGRDYVGKENKDNANDSALVMEIISNKGYSNDGEKAKEIKNDGEKADEFMDVKMEDAGMSFSTSELSSTITNEEDTLSHSCKDLQQPIYQFRNRKSRGSSLTISKENYNLMAQGKTLKFYNAKLGSNLEVKLVNNLDEKGCSKDSYAQRKQRPETNLNLSEFNQNNADSEEVQSEVGSCVTFEDEHHIHNKDMSQTDVDCVTSSTFTPSLFRFSAESESKLRRKHYANKAHGLRVPEQYIKRRKLQNAEEASLVHANFVFGCRLEVGKKRKLIHLHPLDLHCQSRKKLAPHDHRSTQCLSCAFGCNHACNLGCASNMDVSPSFIRIRPCVSSVKCCPNVTFGVAGALTGSSGGS